MNVKNIYKSNDDQYILASKPEDAAEAYELDRSKVATEISKFKDASEVIVSKPTFTVTTEVSPAAAGVDGAAIYPQTDSYFEGETIPFTAVPSTGYPTFVKWTNGDDVELSTDNPYKLEITKDLTLKAVFSV